MEDIQQRVDYYLKHLVGPLVLATAFEVFVQTQDRVFMLTWLANGAILLYIFARFFKESSAHELKWLAALSGLVMTLIVAIVKIFLFKEIWYVFNAFTEPLVVAALMGGFTYIVASVIKKSAHQLLSIKKGGES